MAAKKIQRPVFDGPILNVTVNSDGTVKRAPEIRTPPNSDPNTTSPVLSKDVTLNPNKKTWLRLYIPNTAAPPPSGQKLPLIFYYHGGGFVFCNANSFGFDLFCQRLVEKIGAMVISLEYRLAPENLLPAAYDDAVDGLRWVINTADEWVDNYADLSNCYLSGTSSGGNLAYHAGLRFAPMAAELEPIKVRGLILHHPYFSGTKRTESEEKLANDSILPLSAIDQMFDLCLPEGVDHDHEYCNPLTNGGSKDLDHMRNLGFRVLITGCFDDPLVDAIKECAKMLEGMGFETVKLFGDGYHAMEIFDPSVSGPLFDAILSFIFRGPI